MSDVVMDFYVANHLVATSDPIDERMVYDHLRLDHHFMPQDLVHEFFRPGEPDKITPEYERAALEWLERLRNGDAGEVIWLNPIEFHNTGENVVFIHTHPGPMRIYTGHHLEMARFTLSLMQTVLPAMQGAERSDMLHRIRLAEADIRRSERFS